MLRTVLNMLFGCSHSETTFPITPGRKSQMSSAHRHGTYVVCLDCGQEFQYNWAEMRIGDPVRNRQYAPAAESFSHANH
jgi:hypothetical protein